MRMAKRLAHGVAIVKLRVNDAVGVVVVVDGLRTCPPLLALRQSCIKQIRIVLRLHIGNLDVSMSCPRGRVQSVQNTSVTLTFTSFFKVTFWILFGNPEMAFCRPKWPQNRGSSSVTLKNQVL